jgi:hypothetical protein
MRRNGTSTALTQHAEFFVTSNLVSSYRKARWAKDLGAFAAFYFGDEDHPKLQVGAFASAFTGNLHWDYAYTDALEELEDARLSALDKKDLPWAAALGNRLQLAYDERPWTPNQADADVAWAIEKLASVAAGLN